METEIAMAVPTLWDTAYAQAILKMVDALTGSMLYLGALFVIENSALGRVLFRYADEVRLLEEQAHDMTPSINLPARAALARVNGARILGFAVVFGMVLAW